jgi:hypothetical protein
MIRKLVKVVLALAVIAPVSADAASAEPWIAVRTGLKCSVCHVNRTGGGGRNDFGSAWAYPIRSRRLNDWAAIGFDLRAVGSAALSKPDAAPETPTTQMEITEAQVQLEARFISNILALYIDQTVGPDRAFTREAFGLAEWRGNVPGYAKVGKFLLPYGWRLPLQHTRHRFRGRHRARPADLVRGRYQRQRRRGRGRQRQDDHVLGGCGHEAL